MAVPYSARDQLILSDTLLMTHLCSQKLIALQELKSKWHPAQAFDDRFEAFSKPLMHYQTAAVQHSSGCRLLAVCRSGAGGLYSTRYARSLSLDQILL